MTAPVDVTDREETRLHLLEIADQLEAGHYRRADATIATLLTSTRRHLGEDTDADGVEA